MKRLIVLAAALALSAAASAGVRDPRVNARQARQHERIAQGVASGQLTRHEACALRCEQRAVRAEERRYKADGRLTRRERADLRRDLNRANCDIRRMKRNGRTR
jgi:Ni/Co efflux regulator RcnB